MTYAGRRIERSGQGLGAGGGGRPRLRLLASLATVVAVLGFWLGLAGFVANIPREAGLPPESDGVVALTGGAERISDAVELLAAGRAKRMLISGVNLATSRKEIARLTPNFGELVGCCVDIDHAALNTAGNATETARWARSHGLKSVIVVTSDYHMPRALAEMRRAMPEAELVPHVVPTSRLRGGGLWTDPDLVRLVVWEYVKYLRTKARNLLPGETPSPGRVAIRS